MKALKDFLILPVILGLLPGLIVEISAQTSGKIVGYVTDAQSGEALPGANLLIEDSGMGAATDANGYYIIMRVPPGEYTIVASYLGYQKMHIKNIEVLTDLTTRIDFKLQTEVLQGEEVVITAERPLVRKDLTSSESRLSAETIEKLPVRSMDDLLDIQAGVVRDADNNIHIRGGRSSEIAYMVNGISITDDYYRNQALTLAQESIQELQVISGTFNAEYGNAMSGVINMVTKPAARN